MISSYSVLFAMSLSAAASAAEWRTLDSSALRNSQGFGFQTPGTLPNAAENKLFAAPAFGNAAFGASPFATGSLFSTGTSTRYADRINDKYLFGIETSSGFAAASPFRTQGFGSGFEYNSTSVRLGYDFGNFTPYITSSVTQAKPDLGFTGTQFENGILAQNPSFSARTTTSVGAGFNYSLGSNTSINLGVSVGNAQGQ